ncbi:MAG: hypothetical protein QW763_05575 [Archaeoglobaceae archaeon]
MKFRLFIPVPFLFISLAFGVLLSDPVPIFVFLICFPAYLYKLKLKLVKNKIIEEELEILFFTSIILASVFSLPFNGFDALSHLKRVISLILTSFVAFLAMFSYITEKR